MEQTIAFISGVLLSLLIAGIYKMFNMSRTVTDLELKIQYMLELEAEQNDLYDTLDTLVDDLNTRCDSIENICDDLDERIEECEYEVQEDLESVPLCKCALGKS